MGRLVFVLILACLFVILDVYSYYGLGALFNSGKNFRWFRYVYIGVSVCTYFSIFSIFFIFINGQTNHRAESFNLMTGFVFTMLITKLLFSSLLLIQDGGRVLIGSFNYLIALFAPEYDDTTVFLPQRRQFISTASAFVAGIPLFSMLYGITKGKYQYTVQKIVLSFKDLPEAFDGFKVVQISDIHAGSFDNKEKVKLGIDMINDLNADLICFTGDLVNAEKDEINPYIDIFSTLKANYGKYATLGNHDYYGSYDKTNKLAERAYFDDFFDKFKQMGFELLNNENRTIEINGESIRIVGVENWGAGRWFPKRGDLDRATKNIDSGEFSILMSHDPTHWDEKVLSYNKEMQLTLSGHTHGFQFGFQMPGFKWSPAQYRYKKWLGLYEENGKYLYVNRGFGFLGFPGRVGMWPEISLIELKCVSAEPL